MSVTITGLEARLDAAGVYIQSLHVGAAEAPHEGWFACVKTDRIGNGEVAFGCYGATPAEALSLALAEAAAWVKARKDIR